MRWCAVLGVCLVCGVCGFAADAPSAGTIAAAIEGLADSLDEAGRQALRLPFNDEARLDWSYFPGEREGLVLEALDDVQRQRLFAVLQLCLSASGYEKAEAIRMLEPVLAEMENNPDRDPDRYYLAVYGEPGAEAAWGLAWEGHHISLNWTFAAGKVVASTPQFLGSHPAVVPSGPREGEHVQHAEETLARTLAKSLEGKARDQGAPGGTAPPEILTRMHSQAAPQTEEGVRFAELTEEQQGMLISLLNVHASVQPRAIAEERLQKIRADGLDEVRFLWLGGLEPGEGHYYRIQGKTFLVEYDNTQNHANHIHTVWRDFNGDFGRDLLQEHYREGHGIGNRE